MKYLPKNTLAHYNAAPQFHLFNLSEMPLSVFATATKSYRQYCGHASPEEEAFKFYTLNHLASLVRKGHTPNEPLPAWAQSIMETYVAIASDEGKRLLHYVLSICAREMRHFAENAQGDFWSVLEAKHGKTMKEFIKGLKAYGEDDAVARYMNYPPDVTVGKYITAMACAFDDGAWSSGFGGKAWGAVAHAAEAFLSGKTSMEMFMDTGYTLAHNNGPIFNKGMMYHSYGTQFKMILDVQSSGQVPELVIDPDAHSVYDVEPPSLCKQAVELVRANRPGEFRGHVDWFLLEKLGSKSKYSGYKLHQKKKYGPVEPPPKPTVLKAGGKSFAVTGEWQVFPKQAVKTLQRVSA